MRLRHLRAHGAETSRRLIAIFCLAISPVIFLADTLTDAGVTISILYIILIILIARTRVIPYINFFALYFAVLTTLSYLLSPGLLLHRAATVDLALSLVAIFSCSYIAVRMVTAEEAAQKARSRVGVTSRGVALAELATSIAHEINQPLAATVANASAARRWLDLSTPDLGEARTAIRSAVQSAERAGEIVNGMRRLASKTTLQMASFDVNALLLETADLLQVETKDMQVHVDMRLAAPPPMIEADRVLIQQAFLNVLSNALDALEKVDIHRRKISISTSRRDRDVSVTIGDSGPGAEPDALDQLFDPFYSTKPNGLGIGLALTRSIVEKHGARVRVEHGVPHGMNFEFTFGLHNDAKRPEDDC